MQSHTKTATARIFLETPGPSRYAAYNPNTPIEKADPKTVAYYDAMAWVDGSAELEAAKSAIADIIRSHGATEREVRRFMEHIGYRVAGAVRCGIENWAGAEAEAAVSTPDQVAA